MFHIFSAEWQEIRVSQIFSSLLYHQQNFVHHINKSAFIILNCILNKSVTNELKVHTSGEKRRFQRKTMHIGRNLITYLNSRPKNALDSIFSISLKEWPILLFITFVKIFLVVSCNACGVWGPHVRSCVRSGMRVLNQVGVVVPSTSCPTCSQYAHPK